MRPAYRLPEEVRALVETLERSPDPVFVTDRQNQIVAWNHSAERLLGFSREEAVGASCSSLMEGCDAWGNRYCSQSCPVREMANREEVVNHFDLTLRGRDGRAVVADVNILHLPAPPPHHFFLAHILKPSLRSAPPPREEDGSLPPRPALQAVKDSPDARARKLTQREIEILGMLAAGRTTAEIASVLNISTLTVRNHTQNILEKLEVHSKAEAVAFAFQKRLF